MEGGLRIDRKKLNRWWDQLDEINKRPQKPKWFSVDFSKRRAAFPEMEGKLSA